MLCQGEHCRCAAQSSQMRLSDGTLGYRIQCNNVLTWGDCRQRAGDICGSGGYTVVGQESTSRPYAVVSVYGGTSGMEVNRSLYIKCN